MLSAISHKEPPKKRWGSHALSLDLPVFTCHGWGQRVGRRRVAADIKGNGYRGARGKGCSARTAGVCFSAGRSVAPRELAGRIPFPDRDRRSPPWSRRPPSDDAALRLPTTTLTSSPKSRQYGPEPYHASHLRPDIPFFRAGAKSFRPTQARYSLFSGRNNVMPTTSGPKRA